MRISLIQMQVLETPDDNIKKINSLVRDAVSQGAELVVLPEMCCCEYSNLAFSKYAMSEDCEFINALSALANELDIVLVAGTVPEKDGEKIYNTSYVFNTDGQIIAKHRKAHLFDVNVKNGISFKESDTFEKGDTFTSFNTKWGKMGLAICFDIRFPEFFKENSMDLKMLIIPASFNMTTGPVHWELLFRARAVDNQLFTVGCASAYDNNSSYHSYGHSIVVNPWGDIISQLDDSEGILTCDIDLNEVDEIRSQMPLY